MVLAYKDIYHWKIALAAANVNVQVALNDNLQANVSATVHLFGGDSSHTPFFLLAKFSRKHFDPKAIIHMEHINVLDFDEKSERNLCFSFGKLGIIFNSVSTQLFPPREKW